MIDALVRPIIDPPLHQLGRWLHNRGISPNQITLVGFGFGCLAAPAIIFNLYGLALAFIAFNRLADGLDGAVARAGGQVSDFGGYLDIVVDVLFYGLVVLAFGFATPENMPWALFLLFSFFGSSGSFLAYAIIAQKRGLTTSAQGQKSFFYMAGLMEGSETIIAYALMCLMPTHFPIIALVFGVLCLATAAGRILQARAAFTEPAAGGGQEKQ